MNEYISSQFLYPYSHFTNMHSHTRKQLDSNTLQAWIVKCLNGWNLTPPATGWQYMMTSPYGNIFRVTGPLCGEFTGEFSSQRPVTRSFDIFFDLHLNKQLSKQWRRRWFETPAHSLWRHSNEFCQINMGNEIFCQTLSQYLFVF